jgi:hypothetical protein
MRKHRSYPIDFKRQAAQEYLAGETLHGLAKRHEISRNLVRIWVAKGVRGMASARPSSIGCHPQCWRKECLIIHLDLAGLSHGRAAMNLRLQLLRRSAPVRRRKASLYRRLVASTSSALSFGAGASPFQRPARLSASRKSRKGCLSKLGCGCPAR